MQPQPVQAAERRRDIRSRFGVPGIVVLSLMIGTCSRMPGSFEQVRLEGVLKAHHDPKGGGLPGQFSLSAPVPASVAYVIRGIRKGERISLAFSSNIPKQCHQPLRNLWALPH